MAVTHQGAILSFCVTPQTAPTSQTEFEALTWLPIPNVVEAPSFTIEDNILVENYLDSDIAAKQKGFRQAADTTFVIGMNPGNAGHDALDAASRTKSIYAFKYELDNAGSGSTGTITYALAVLGGGGLNGGGGEEFARRTYNLGVTDQFPIELDPA